MMDSDRFHDIELGEFPARIVETALRMMKHIKNDRVSLDFGQTRARIPLEMAPHIVHGDEPEVEWSHLPPAAGCHFMLERKIRGKPLAEMSSGST